MVIEGVVRDRGKEAKVATKRQCEGECGDGTVLCLECWCPGYDSLV